MAGATIVLIQPTYNSQYDLYMPLTATEVKQALEKDPDIQAVYLTSPNMEGLVANYPEIKAVINAHSEAHCSDD